MPADESRGDRTQSFVPLINGTMVSHYRIAEKIGAGVFPRANGRKITD
jgi:hypothetical protein